MAYKYWSEVDIQEGIKLYREGYNFTQIGDVIKKNKSQVRQKLFSLGVHKPKNRVSRDYLYSVGQVVNRTLKIVEQTRIENKTSRKGYLVQSLAYPNEDFYKISEEHLKRGQGCAYSTGARVCKENSLWGIETIRDNIIDVEESKKIASQSHKKILFKCSTVGCTNTKEIVVSSLVNQGFSCPSCSKGTSYPERFFTAYLNYYSIKHEYQVRFNDLKGHVFDYRITLGDKTFLVETHGEQHYLLEDKGYHNAELIKRKDNIKREYAKKNDIRYIELDCRESSFEFIKNSIKENIWLPNIEEDDETYIMEFIKDSSKYDVQEIIKLYEIDKLSLCKIAKKHNTSTCVISKILEQNGIKRRKNTKAVMCIETGIVYDSGTEAHLQTGIANSNISKCCKNPQKTAGGYHWKYIN